MELPSLEKMRDRELLDSQMFSRIVNGVATRNYEEVINGFAGKTGIKKSSVSRAFKRASKKDLDQQHPFGRARESYSDEIDNNAHAQITQSLHGICCIRRSGGGTKNSNKSIGLDLSLT